MHALPPVLALVIALAITTPILRHLTDEGLTRENWRGVRVPFPAGIAIVAAGLLAAGACAAIAILADDELFFAGAGAVMTYGLGVALLGLIDDLLAGSSRGWRGHGAAVASGAFSTGALKAVGSLALAAYVLGSLTIGSGHYLLAIALLVLTTNLFNLLDLRPGRAVKVLTLLGAGLTLGTWDARPLAAVGIFAAPALVVGLFDVRERAMLGDTGANLIGGVAGLWLLLSLGTRGQAIALAIVLGLTIYGEFRSLSALIERTPILRQIDSIGRNASHA